MTETNGTNGTSTASSDPTVLQSKVKAWREAGGKVPDKKTAQGLLKKFVEITKAKEKAEADLEAAAKALSEHSVAMVDAFGDNQIEVGGRRYFAASREDRIFYRTMTPRTENVIVAD